jgi:poly(A) polymerase
VLDWFRRMTNKKNSTSPADDGKSPATSRPGPVDPPHPALTLNPEKPPEALVVPRPEHAVSRKLISFNALKVMGRLIRQGHKAYLVGGSIRDISIGRRPKDFDVATDARPEQVRKLFRNSRMIGRRFRLVHVFFGGGEIVEVSTFRKGIPFDPDNDTQLIDENAYGTPGEDACRRDLTINGLFYDLDTYAIYDYVGGMRDINDRIVRVIGDPTLRFREDPVRMLRAIRHATGTGFTIEPVTAKALKDNAVEILKTNPSRLRDEFLRELTEGRAARSLPMMFDCGLLGHIMPITTEVFTDSEVGREAYEQWIENLKGLDDTIQRRSRHIEITLPLICAAFTAPLARAQRFAEKAGDPRRLRGFLPGAFRDFLKPVLQSVGISRGHAETAALALVGLYNLEVAVQTGGKLPKSLTRKASFQAALLLYQIEMRGRQERLPQSVYNLARERDSLLFSRPPRPGDEEDPPDRPTRPRRPAAPGDASTAPTERKRRRRGGKGRGSGAKREARPDQPKPERTDQPKPQKKPVVLDASLVFDESSLSDPDATDS